MHLRRYGQAWQGSGGAATEETGGNKPRSIRFGHSRIACRIPSNRIVCVIGGGIPRTALHALQCRNQCISKEVFDSARLLV
jgi:hypothetical protein